MTVGLGTLDDGCEGWRLGFHRMGAVKGNSRSFMICWFLLYVANDFFWGWGSLLLCVNGNFKMFFFACEPKEFL